MEISQDILDETCRAILRRERPNSRVGFDDLPEPDKDSLRAIVRRAIANSGHSSRTPEKS